MVNFNGARYLPVTLTAVQAIRDRFTDVLLVDNGSTDYAVEDAERAFPDLTVIRLGENRGPGTARNEGLRRARSDRILFIDNDVVLHPDCPHELGAALDRNPDAVMAMARVLFADDPETVQFDGAGSHFIGLMTLRHASTRLEPLRDAEARRGVGVDPESGSLVSACFMTDRGRWGLEPLFDEELFLYLEDHEAGLRARLLGHGVISAPAALCYHGPGTPGISIRETGRHTSLRVQQTILNRWQLVLKLYSLRSLLLLAPALLLFEIFQLLGALRKGWLREWSAAAREATRRLPSLARRRRSFQARRRLSDGAVLEGGPIPFNPATHATRLERRARSVLDAMAAANWRLVRRALGAGRQPRSPGKAMRS